MKNLLTIMVALAVSLIGCQEDVPTPYVGDYLIFGHFYGECYGESCVVTFKLEEDRLLQDTRAQHLGQPFNFEEDYRVLERADFERAQELLTVFPDSLLAQPDARFGCPDCRDQGGLYIEYQQGSRRGSWAIDQDQDEVPAYLHDFMDQVNETIRLLNGQ